MASTSAGADCLGGAGVRLRWHPFLSECFEVVHHVSFGVEVPGRNAAKHDRSRKDLPHNSSSQQEERPGDSYPFPAIHHPVAHSEIADTKGCKRYQDDRADRVEYRKP